MANSIYQIRGLSFGLALLTLSACASTPTNFNKVVPYSEIPTTFEHHWDETTHPFTGASVIDVDGDGREEIFIGGGNGQDDQLLRFEDDQLVNVIEGTGLSDTPATYGSVSIDIDNDNDTDLVVSRESGIYLLLNDAGVFTSKKFDVQLPPKSVVLGIAASDIDHDGDADLYLSVFVNFPNFKSATFNDAEHAKTNKLLLNNGDLSFTDITEASGTSGKQNTFLSLFTDLDNDGWQDLVVSQNTGEVEIFKNNKDLTFTEISTNSGYGFWMGVAIGDIDNDGDQDLFFSNVGNSIPKFLTTGDIEDDQAHNLDWLILRNDGNFSFTEVTREYGVHDEGFAWGGIFEDLNLDGQLDLIVAQNYIKWPFHSLFKLSGKALLQPAENKPFEQVDDLALDNPYYGQSPLSVDFNNDGKLDLIWLNMDGPTRAFINNSPADTFVVTVPENPTLLGTRVRLITSKGTSYTKEVMTSVGMLTDQSPHLYFALSEGEVAKQLEVKGVMGNETIELSNNDSRFDLSTLLKPNN